MAGLRQGYDPNGFYCELLNGATNSPIRDRRAAMSCADLARRAADVEQVLYNLGITFTIYFESEAMDRILPFDLIFGNPTTGRRRRASSCCTSTQSFSKSKNPLEASHVGRSTL